MNKYVVVNDNRVKRVIVSNDPSKIKLESGDEIKNASNRRVRRGDVILSSTPVPAPVKKKDYLYLKIGTAVAAASGIAGAVYYFGGF